jgi:hypothetical protein
VAVSVSGRKESDLGPRRAIPSEGHNPGKRLGRNPSPKVDLNIRIVSEIDFDLRGLDKPSGKAKPEATMQMIRGAGRHNPETPVDRSASPVAVRRVCSHPFSETMKGLDPATQKEIGASRNSLLRKTPVKRRPVQHHRLVAIGCNRKQVPAWRMKPGAPQGRQDAILWQREPREAFSGQ